MTDTIRLKRFIYAMNAGFQDVATPSTMPSELADQLHDLVAHDDWLPDAFAEPGVNSYRQYLLYCDPFERFSVVSFVWAAGQKTPVHDHTVWGAIGQLRGTEISTPYSREQSGALQAKAPQTSEPRSVVTFTPERGDIHEVCNPGPETAISIHVYGGNIGAIARSTFDPDSGVASSFVSGYSSDVMPNIWHESPQ